MTKRVQLVIALLIVQLLLGCGTSMPSAPSPVTPSIPVTPSSPVTPQAPSAFVPNVTLSGTVSEMVQDELIPIEGASVYCESCGEGTHSWASTNNKGFYTFTGVWGNHFVIWVGKDGYQDPPGQTNKGFPSGGGWRDVTMSGDTRLDVQLARR